MQITVRLLTGINIKLNVTPYDTIQDLKTKIEGELSFPPQQQRLIFGAQTLEDNKTLSYYNIKQNASIFLVLSLRSSQQQIRNEATTTSIQVFVRTMSGFTWTFDIEPNAKVYDLKKKNLQSRNGFVGGSK